MSEEFYNDYCKYCKHSDECDRSCETSFNPDTDTEPKWFEHE